MDPSCSWYSGHIWLAEDRGSALQNVIEGLNPNYPWKNFGSLGEAGGCANDIKCQLNKAAEIFGWRVGLIE